MEPGEFKLLGALGPVLDENGNIRPDNDNIKVSAIFKVTGLSPSTRATGGVGDMEMDFECMQIGNDNGEVTVGLSLEPINILGPQILALRAAKSQVNVETSVAVASKPENSTPKTPNAKLLAQRIIQNAFNFLASFSSGGAHDVVPLKAFEDWWRKFEDKMNSDPEYLERDT